jgi:hypothetical protein
MREALNALMPDGAAWRPAFGGDYDRLLNGVARNKQDVFDDLSALANIRDPYNCPIELLPDLEREYGISPNNALTEKERRRSLAAIRYKSLGLATAQKLQRALDMAGFGYGGYGLIVTPNSSPATDPYPIVEANFVMTAHEFPSIFCAGNTDVAFAGYGGGGYYLVSGDYFTSRPLYPQAGEIVARASDGSDYRSGYECAGFYNEMVVIDENENNRSPDEPWWPLIFFVGGVVTRNPDGRITNVASVDVPAGRKQELHRMILRIKPCGIWAAMMVRYF